MGQLGLIWGLRTLDIGSGFRAGAPPLYISIYMFILIFSIGKHCSQGGPLRIYLNIYIYYDYIYVVTPPPP